MLTPVLIGVNDSLAPARYGPENLQITVAGACYGYGFNGFPDHPGVTDANAIYHLNPVHAGPYRRLMLRYRYGVRTDDHWSTLNFPGASANRVYFVSLPCYELNRTMIEYDF